MRKMLNYLPDKPGGDSWERQLQFCVGFALDVVSACRSRSSGAACHG